MRIRSAMVLFLLLALAAAFAATACADPCERVVRQLNRKLAPKIDEKELVDVLRRLNATSNARLPDKFVTKRQARKQGWKPGKDLWATARLEGKSIGGDLFGNRERKLSDGAKVWREADLDYQGGHRGPKRIIFSNDGLRMITVDHYKSFTEVPACQ